jgi:hypothetical protein
MKKETIEKEQVRKEVLAMIRRTALLHYAYAKTLMNELGEKEGKALALKAIELYGALVGSDVRKETESKGLDLLPQNYQEDLPTLGWEIEKVEVDGETRARVHMCHLARVWKELGAHEIGRLYCSMDEAKYQSYNADLTCVHEKNLLDGDAYCELAVRTRIPDDSSGC